MGRMETIHRGLDEKEQQRYLKDALAFTVPSGDRIGMSIPLLEEYDFVDDKNIEGHLEKRFVRLHNAYFKDVLDEIGKGGCNYHTYITAGDVKRKAVPRNLSVLIKRVGNITKYEAEYYNKKMCSEVISSRVLNFFGCDTVYNRLYDSKGELFVFSLDFLRPYEHYYQALGISDKNEIWASNPFKANLESIESDIDILKKRLEFEFGATSVKANKEYIKEEFVMSYMVRVFLLGDSDFNSRNYGFIYDVKENCIKSAPNHDFEYAFGMNACNFGEFDHEFNDIDDDYPELMDEFLEKVRKLSKNRLFGKSKFDKIFLQEAGKNEYVSKFPDYIKNNAEYILDYAEKHRPMGRGK